MRQPSERGWTNPVGDQKDRAAEWSGCRCAWSDMGRRVQDAIVASSNNEGKCEVVATEADGEPFLFPNDLCFGPDGAIYLTDSGIYTDDFAPNNQIRPDYMDLHYDGRLYRIDSETGVVEKMDQGLQFTNESRLALTN